MTSLINVRHLEPNDVPAINEIYNHYILNTPITFDIDPKSVEERIAWATTFAEQGRYQCLVATEGEAFLGWACSGPYRAKAAYQTSVEVSIYLDPNASGRGIGVALYDALFEELKTEGIHRALAAITHPNEASVALHKRFGFSEIGLFAEVGHKFEKYWDVLWMEKHL